MFSNFWEWILIIFVLVLIFGADHLHIWKAVAIHKIEEIKKIAAEKRQEHKQNNKDK